jgi:hypothetical protein
MARRDAQIFEGAPCRLGHTTRYVSSRHCVECALGKSERRRRERPVEIRVSKASAKRKKPERYRTAIQHWVSANRERHRATKRAYKRANPGRSRADCVARRAAKRKRLPAWADLDAIRRFYEGCPSGYHVDHVIPLRGKTVSGLHVLGNLQYLPAEVNLAKGNRYG